MHFGAADPHGHLYIKPFNKKLCGDTAKAGIYKVISNGVNKAEVENLKTPSGIAWNKYTNKFYYTDVCGTTITECLWSPLTSDLSSCRVVYTLQTTIPNAGIQSLAVDRRGNLYFFVFNQGLLYKVSPITGQVLWTHQFEIPVLVNMAFGGPLLDDLMITTGAVVLNTADGNRVPTTLPANSGATFILKGLATRGFIANAYNRYNLL